MSIERIVFLSLALLSLSASAIAQAPATMRVDFYHSGNSETEMFSLDRVVLEPLPWTGNMQHPIDKTLRGKYLFEIVAPGSGAVAWSRSFSSIYGEWETTREARNMNRTYHESVRFPAQPDEFVLVLKKRNAKNAFEEIWRLPVDPNGYTVHRESAAHAYRVVAILDNGDPATKVDLLILGDGYTEDEHDRFIAKAREATDILFATSPFRERKDDFNVWALAPASRASGVSRPSTRTYRDSPLGTAYDAFGAVRYMLTFDNRNMRRIASSTPYDFVEILANNEVYGGGGIYGLYATAAADNEWLPYLFVHDFAHHFAGLADEYYTSAAVYESPEVVVEPYEPNVTALLDPGDLKWNHLVTPNTPLPTPWPKAEFEEHSIAVQERRAAMRAANVSEDEMNALFRYTKEFTADLFSRAEHRDAIGAFEGANYQARGFYRSQLNCLMFTRVDYFCRVCSAAIEDVIDEYSRP